MHSVLVPIIDRTSLLWSDDMKNCERYRPIRGFDFEMNSVLKTSAAQRYIAPGARTQLRLASQRAAKTRGFDNFYFRHDLFRMAFDSAPSLMRAPAVTVQTSCRKRSPHASCFYPSVALLPDVKRFGRWSNRIILSTLVQVAILVYIFAFQHDDY